MDWTRKVNPVTGVYHYAPLLQALEQRCRLSPPAAADGFQVALTSVVWREAWKYGERAFRYCQHDVGHALAALRYAAAALGWRVELLPEWDGPRIDRLLGLDRAEDFAGAELETPELMVQVRVNAGAGPASGGPTPVASEWFGRANQLSATHVAWPVIETAIAASERLAAPAAPSGPEVTWAPPFDAWPWPPRLHLVLFVHRVTGLEPGLYLWLRAPADATALRAVFDPKLKWEAATDSVSTAPLYRLGGGDLQAFARTLSCQQDIAADGAFSLGMLAQFEPVLRARGAAAYRELFWEAGMIGQALYLAAEAAGMRGTGIGCYFDDVLHGLLGVNSHAWQSLYHFTVGKPIEDVRLRTVAPYAHLAE